MIKRKKDSHKGDNGKIMIIGGSPDFYGAPILCSLSAEYSGSDLVFPFMPKCHVESAKTYSLNFIINTFQKDFLTLKDVKTILKFSKNVDIAIIGSGLGENPETKKAVKKILAYLTIPTVIDADALVYTNSIPKNSVLTPHRGEFKELTGDDPTGENVQKWAKHFDSVILCKGEQDIIADADHLAFNDTGNPLMTVGGSGDVLAGLVGGFIAQGMAPFDSAKHAVKILGKIADNLSKTQNALRAIDLIRDIPTIT